MIEMIALWAFPVGVLIGYILIKLTDKSVEPETTGFLFGVWIMYGLTFIFR